MAVITNVFKDTARLVKVAWVAHKLGDSGFQAFNSVMSLRLSAEFITVEAADNLVQAGYASSAKLCRSIKAEGPEREGPKAQMHVVALDYYKYINKGVRGTKGGRSVAGFTFKNDHPSRQMVTSIAHWLKNNNKISVQQVKRQGIHKSKKQQVTLSVMHAAYIIARSIKQKGIQPNYFFDKAVGRNKVIARERLRRAFAEDIINSLENI